MSNGIRYVLFRDAIDVGGKEGSVKSWSKDKHEKTISIEREGAFIVLTPNTSDGCAREVPMTNVIYIQREPKAKAVEFKPDGKAAAVVPAGKGPAS